MGVHRVRGTASIVICGEDITETSDEGIVGNGAGVARPDESTEKFLASGPVEGRPKAFVPGFRDSTARKWFLRPYRLVDV